ncbi:MAG: hypothetical protein IPP63_12060 [Chloracidobacterium sp.]|nr:hypothetical protein [Chloracidobacterium sp.]
MNRSGTVTVEGWNRSDINISATLEAPAANIVPQNLSGTIVVNLVKDNQGRPEVGNVNFTIRVPYYAQVDIETRIGNLNVSSVSSGFVRAKISSEGDITLTNIGANTVSAENLTGDIFLTVRSRMAVIIAFHQCGAVSIFAFRPIRISDLLQRLPRREISRWAIFQAAISAF